MGKIAVILVILLMSLPVMAFGSINPLGDIEVSQKGNPLAKCRAITISPQDVNIDAGNSQSYSCEAFDKKGNSLGDITTLATFTISQSAGGNWQGNVYISENPGSWVVTAQFKRHTVRTQLTVSPIPEPLPEPLPKPLPEPLPEPSPSPPLELPEPFEGRLFQSDGRMIGEYEDVIAFPYRSYTDYKNYLHIVTNGEAKDYLLPNSDGMNMAHVSAVMTARDEIWIAFNIPIIINQYHIGSDAVTLVSSTTLGDSKSRLKDLIELDNGKLFVAWHQFERNKVDGEGNPGIDVGFAYRTLDGNWHTLPYTWVFPFSLPATHGAVCQHPDDGSIWFFCQPDGSGFTCVIHLIEIDGEISVDWTDYDFLNKYDGAMAPEGELPFFSAIGDKQRNAIILAYQSDDWQMFSIEPFCKGARPAIIQINSDATKSLLFELWRV